MTPVAARRHRATPALALVLLVTGAGLVSVLATSLGLFPLFGPAGLSTQGYVAVGADLRPAVRETLVIAISSTVLAAVAGLLVGTVVLVSSRHRWLVGGLAAGVVAVPQLVGAASVDLLIGDTGLLPRILGLGPERWPDLVGGAWPVATVLEFAWKESAFVGVVVIATIGRRLTDLLEVAAVLGAGPWRRWSRVLVPAALPAVAGSSVIVLVYTVGSYEVPWLLGRSYPEPLPVMAYRLFGSIDLAARPQAAATAVVGAAVAGATVLLIGMSTLGHRRARRSSGR